MEVKPKIIQILGRYRIDRKTIKDDLIAGTTLGVESIPDAMAAGVLAGVNPLHGLYAVMLSTPVGALFASSEYMSIQTTSALSLIVAGVAAVHYGESASEALFTLTLLVGIFMLVFGILRLGTLLRFIPNAVMTGFISGIAVLIILGQLGDFTGFSSSQSNKVAQTVDLIFNLNQVDLQTLAIGLVTVILIVMLAKTRLSSFGMVVALILGSLMVPLFGWDAIEQVKDVSTIPSTLPRPVLPSLRLIQGLVVPAMSIAIVGLVQGAGISQGYINPDGKYPDSSKDFLGEGAANVAASLFQGMPVGGSLSATGLVVSSGARSRWANIFAGFVIAITLLLFGDLVSSLAMASLAGLLIVVGFQTLKPHEIETVWKTGSVQQVVMALTFIATLFIPLQYAVLIGVAISILLYAFNESNRLTIVQWIWEEGELPLERPAPEELASNEVTLLIPYGSLFFAAAPTFEKQLPDLDSSNMAVVVLGLKGHTEVGSTFLDVIERFSEELKKRNSRIYLAEVSRNVRDQLERTGKMKGIGRRSVFLATERFGESMIHAQHTAQDWIEREEEKNHAKNPGGD